MNIYYAGKFLILKFRKLSSLPTIISVHKIRVFNMNTANKNQTLLN